MLWLVLLGGGAAAVWYLARNEPRELAPSNVNPPTPPVNVPSATSSTPPSSPAPPPSSSPGIRPSTSNRRMLVLRLDVHVNGLEQMVGGIDAAWIRERIDPVVRDLVPDAQREVTFPDVPAARSGVQEIDPGFRVVVAWLLAAGIEPTEQQLSRWRTWIETRLRRSEHGARIHDVRMYVRDA